MEPNFADKTIWTGDNLDILRGMNSESVDLIYLDPPFNSNRNYSAPGGERGGGGCVQGYVDAFGPGCVLDGEDVPSPLRQSFGKLKTGTGVR